MVKIFFISITHRWLLSIGKNSCHRPDIILPCFLHFLNFFFCLFSYIPSFFFFSFLQYGFFFVAIWFYSFLSFYRLFFDSQVVLSFLSFLYTIGYRLACGFNWTPTHPTIRGYFYRIIRLTSIYLLGDKIPCIQVPTDWDVEDRVWSSQVTVSNKHLKKPGVYIYRKAVIIITTWWDRRCPRGVMVKTMDSRIVLSEFVLQSRYYGHSPTNPLIFPAMG